MAYRHGAIFVRDVREYSTPIDRNQKAKIIFLAEKLERSSKAANKRNGNLGYIGLAVLRALILTFHNRQTGLCCPGYDALQRVTGLCRQSISEALKRLKAAGVVTVTRRLTRVVKNGIVICQQATNLYQITAPGPGTSPARAARPGKPFPQRGILAALAASALIRAESTGKGGTLKAVEKNFSYVTPSPQDWRIRERALMAARMK